MVSNCLSGWFSEPIAAFLPPSLRCGFFTSPKKPYRELGQGDDLNLHIPIEQNLDRLLFTNALNLKNIEPQTDSLRF
jgi:hypothetical protein